MTDHYATLGVERDASAEDIRRAYRRLARDLHPDTGGDGARMSELNHAYDVLRDPDARAAYDAGDASGKPITVDEIAEAMLMKAFAEALAKPGRNAVTTARQQIGQQVTNASTGIEAARAAVDLLHKRRDKISVAGGGRNAAHFVIDGMIANVERSAAACRETLDAAGIALRLLDNYSDREEDAPPAPPSFLRHFTR